MSQRLLFFFASRRRHTIYWRDWSSDVGSSDLTAGLLSGAQGPGRDADGALGLDLLVVLDAPQLGVESAAVLEIGRASCRERVEISVVAVSLKKKRHVATGHHGISLDNGKRVYL